MFRLLPIASLALSAVLSPALAQQPTQQQRDAIRSACRSDFMANCSSVTPGGKEAFECLLNNQTKLSAACKAAVTAAAPKPAETAAPATAPASTSAPAAATAAPPKPVTPPAAAAAGTQDEQLKAVRKACTLDDISVHCSWIAPNNPELLLCLHANLTDLSPGCQTAVAALPPPSPGAAVEAKPSEPAKKPAPPPRAAAKPALAPTAAMMPPAPGKPTPEQTAAIRSACRSDFMAKCSGVQPGGAEAFQCLQRNAAGLSPGCRTAVAAIGGGGGAAAAPAGAAGMPAAPSAASAVAPLTPRPFIMPARRLFIVRTCRADVIRLCSAGASGGRIIDCLAANAPSLSQPCYDAIARVSQ